MSEEQKKDLKRVLNMALTNLTFSTATTNGRKRTRIEIYNMLEELGLE